MSTYRQTLGAWGEQTAAKFLTARGFEILEHNFRARPDEIDLIAKRGDKIHFVEVKTRTAHSVQNFDTPQTSVTARKRQSLIRAAYAYLAHHQPQNNAEWQIDVIAITAFPHNQPRIEYLPAAVEET